MEYRRALFLGPILFIVYIYDFGANFNSYMLKFVEYANVFSEVSSLDKVANLQSDLDKLHKWSEDWQMMTMLKSVNVYILAIKMLMQFTP